ncbi:MAG: hypothetical protein EBT38_04710 [Acidimicrobiia bacterium]|nr:hypothetical protein [Acidimicrobiia bacterium]
MDNKGSLAAYLGRESLVFEPVEVAPNLFAMAMNTEDSLREYIRLFLRLPVIGSLTPLARIFDFVANAAPAVKEILAVGKLCYEVREKHYDLVVVDSKRALRGASVGTRRTRHSRANRRDRRANQVDEQPTA